MSHHLQFAFLGPHGNYFASTTKVVNGYATGPLPVVKIHGLPKDLSDYLLDQCRRRRYVQNIRGHDFLAHVGHWVAGDRSEYLVCRPSLLGELDELRRFVSPAHPNVLLSLGPMPGSFWADNLRSRYRWSNLPAELDDALQRIVCADGYGGIKDVSINSAGGWVMQWKKGKKYEYGGLLSAELKRVLKRGQETGKVIDHLYLNHQNEKEYLLIFSDGTSSISLHCDFETSLKDLYDLIPAYKKHAERNWNFTPSCVCSPLQQQHSNARYYRSRGLFLLRSGRAAELAMKYLNEARRLNWQDMEYHDDYATALIAVRQAIQDVTLDEWIARRVDSRLIPPNPGNERHTFRVEYYQRVMETGRFETLQARLQRVRESIVQPQKRLDVQPQWSYVEERGEGSDDMAELDAILSNVSRNTGTISVELEGSPIS